jgi:hypothetical protein
MSYLQVLPYFNIITYSSSKAPACILDFVYDSFGDRSSVSWVGCDVIRQATVYYRNSPASTLPQTTSASTSISTSTTLKPQTAESTHPTPEPVPSPEKSKAWIAGLVIGGLLVVGLVAGLILYILKLRKSSNKPAPNYGQESYPSPLPPQNMYQAPNGYPQQPMVYGAPSPPMTQTLYGESKVMASRSAPRYSQLSPSPSQPVAVELGSYQ